MFPFPIEASVSAVDARSDPVLYVIKTVWDGEEATITKRYSQFHALREALGREHAQLPGMPPRFHLADKHDRVFLVDRKEGLDRFLKSCFDHPTISSSPELVAFLAPALACLWNSAVDARAFSADVKVEELARELDASRAETAIIEAALAKKLAASANERALRATMRFWQAEVPEKADAAAPRAPAASVPGSLRRSMPAPSTAITAADRKPLLNRAKTAATLFRSEQQRKQHANVALQHALGLGGKPGLRARTLSEAGSVLGAGTGSSARGDAENMSLSGFTSVY